MSTYVCNVERDEAEEPLEAPVMNFSKKEKKVAACNSSDEAKEEPLELPTTHSDKEQQ